MYPNCNFGDVRQVGGNTDLEGRAELCIDAMWRSICDNMRSASDANVLCRCCCECYEWMNATSGASCSSVLPARELSEPSQWVCKTCGLAYEFFFSKQWWYENKTLNRINNNTKPEWLSKVMILDDWFILIGLDYNLLSISTESFGYYVYGYYGLMVRFSISGQYVLYDWQNCKLFPKHN